MSETELFKQRLEFIGNKDNSEEMERLKKEYTFHSLKFEEGMDRWLDLWRRPKKIHLKNFEFNVIIFL